MQFPNVSDAVIIPSARRKKQYFHVKCRIMVHTIFKYYMYDKNGLQLEVK